MTEILYFILILENKQRKITPEIIPIYYVLSISASVAVAQTVR